MVGVNYQAEIWNPNTGQWTRGAEAVRARLYHSTALLLPDASVSMAGGGNPGPQFNDNAEIYYPPYLVQFRRRMGEPPSHRLGADIHRNQPGIRH